VNKDLKRTRSTKKAATQNRGGSKTPQTNICVHTKNEDSTNNSPKELEANTHIPGPRTTKQ